MAKKLKIVHIVSELSPYSKTGGLADVARSLPKALSRSGQEVMIITPLYGQVTDKKKHKIRKVFSKIKVFINSQESVEVNYHRAYLMEDVPVYFIENQKYFSKHQQIYGSAKENARFLIFSIAALKLLSLLKFKADIIHCHDWQTGLVPYYLKTDFRYSKTLKKAKTVYTIHNLAFQLGHNWWEVPLEKRDYGRKKIPRLADPELENVNFAKRAILSADLINTVSESYREEIMTRKFGQDLHRILKNREDRLFGIINGIDYNTYNPEKDKSLYRQYSWQNSEEKLKNKIYLQKKFSLPEDKDVPIFCMTSRVTFQKGFEMIISLMPQLLKLSAQFIVLGAGDKNYIKSLEKLSRQYPHKLKVLPSHEANQKYETLVYAGADFFLLPSVHEPCGLNQMIAMRYGCAPIVRAIGGLSDTVENFNPSTKRGNGFSFRGEDPILFYGAIIRALENYKHQKIWQLLVKRIMRQSNSWELPAKKYLKLYRKVLKK